MTMLHDLFFKPTDGEAHLRRKLDAAMKHAEDLEEALLVPDPMEFTDPRRHVEICFERQKAAHAWRRSSSLQSQLNGAENRRYSRGLAGWLAIGFGSQLFLKSGLSWESAAAIIKFLGGLV